MNVTEDALRLATETKEPFSGLFGSDEQSVMRRFFLSCSKEEQEELRRVAETVEALLSADRIDKRGQKCNHLFCPLPIFVSIGL